MYIVPSNKQSLNFTIMNYQDIEKKHSAAMAQILKDRMTAENAASEEYNEKKRQLSESLIRFRRKKMDEYTKLTQDIAVAKVHLLEKKGRGTPNEVLEAEKRYAYERCDYEKAQHRLKVEIACFMDYISNERQVLTKEYSHKLNTIRLKAHARIGEVKEVFYRETEAYREWKRLQVN